MKLAVGNEIRWFAAILVVVAMLAATMTSPAIGQREIDWHPIPENRFFIVFSAPGLREATKRFDRGTTRISVYYLGRWVGSSGPFRQATIMATRVGSRGVFTMYARRGVEAFAKKILRNRRWTSGQVRKTRNVLGELEYLPVFLEDAYCVFFYQFWRRGHVRNLLRGNYCVASASNLTDSEMLPILKGIRARE